MFIHCIHIYSHSLPLCLLEYTNIPITIIMIIIISNTIPPIAPAITGTAPEPVAVVDAVDGIVVETIETILDGMSVTDTVVVAITYKMHMYMYIINTYWYV